ncbi:MAG TPA: hypothetical protein VGF49_23070 [Candidatus Solibacter sp.]|jgi:hypothetical protein
MHEIRTTIPPECVAEAARLAHAAGIERVNIAEVFVEGPNEHRRLLSVETSTPQARAFVESFLHSPVLSAAGCTLTSREVRAIVDGGPVSKLTHPMSEPFPDVIQDLWQLSHITPSYVGRAAAGAILLATGILNDDPIAIVAAALFLPFLSQALSVSLGMWSRDRQLILHGMRAVLLSTVLAFAAGAAVAWIQGGPIRYAGFKSPLNSFFISCIIGVTAGLSTADDTGRRYLIGVAAAVQLAIFPVWLGAVAVLGMPAHETLYSRMLSFGINLTTITAAALAAYASLHLRSSRR